MFSAGVLWTMLNFQCSGDKQAENYKPAYYLLLGDGGILPQQQIIVADIVKYFMGIIWQHRKAKVEIKIKI